MDNLLASWREFVTDKKDRKDVAEFLSKFWSNIYHLQDDLATKVYRHGGYSAFIINDPKPRDIHKATVRDRLLHHAVCRILYPFFDTKFIHDSYSCRDNKGTHRAINRFREFAGKVSRNHTRTCWVLKCDIRKFFASIDHPVLQSILAKYIDDKDILKLLGKVIGSFNTSGKLNTGLPLGNLTSQLLVNIYMNEFDHWMKRAMKVKYYIRYADDFVILSDDRDYLLEFTFKIGEFLEDRLKLALHPDKVSIRAFASGIDFLGWVHFSTHRVLRTTTKKRMFRRIHENPKAETIDSYLGLLLHGDSHKLSLNIKKCKVRRVEASPEVG